MTEMARPFTFSTKSVFWGNLMCWIQKSTSPIWIITLSHHTSSKSVMCDELTMTGILNRETDVRFELSGVDYPYTLTLVRIEIILDHFRGRYRFRGGGTSKIVDPTFDAESNASEFRSIRAFLAELQRFWEMTIFRMSPVISNSEVRSQHMRYHSTRNSVFYFVCEFQLNRL